ncbi:MAG: hypothetical protein LBE98_02210 [Puniceicoccales bacterium]|jgi:hypothetical protein|nr:hypothetical protein [Puniceicoccales bacterium]
MEILQKVNNGQQALGQIPATRISSTMADFPKPDPSFFGRRSVSVSPFSRMELIPVQMPNGALRFVTPKDIIQNRKFLSLFLSKAERQLGSAQVQNEIIAIPDDPRAKTPTVRKLINLAPISINGKYYDCPAICKLILSYPVIAGRALKESGR